MVRIRLLLLAAVVVLGAVPPAHSAQAAVVTWRCASANLPKTAAGALHGRATACMHDVFAHYYTGVPGPSHVKRYGYVTIALCRDSSCTTGSYETMDFEVDPLLRHASVHVTRPGWSVTFELKGTGDPALQHELGLWSGYAFVSRPAVGTATITAGYGTVTGPVDANASRLLTQAAAIGAP